MNATAAYTDCWITPKLKAHLGHKHSHFASGRHADADQVQLKTYVGQKEWHQQIGNSMRQILNTGTALKGHNPTLAPKGLLNNNMYKP
jgi:hypothetical protein